MRLGRYFGDAMFAEELLDPGTSHLHAFKLEEDSWLALV